MRKTIFPLLILLMTSVCLFAQTARVQVIHNSPDPLFDTVDVEVNGALLPALDDLTFRSATPFMDVAAGVPINITLKNAASTVTYGTVSFDSLQANQTYAIIANGVADTSMFNPNPDGLNTSFTLVALSGVEETGQNGMGNADLTIFHGSPDAPSVDIIARGIATIADNVPYLSGGSVSVPAASYTIDVADSTGSTVVASYTADVSGLGGGAAIVFASGFLNSGQGAAFGLWVALPSGVTFPLPTASAPAAPARVQIIHNAADPAAALVQISLNDGALVLDSVAFRDATPFFDAPSGIPIKVEVNTPDGMTNIATFNYDSLASGSTYVIIANGVATPSSFTANPDMKSIDFNLYIYDMGQEMATNSGKADLLFFHGATDAPTVDVIANGSVTLSNDLSYGDFDGYVSVDPLDYTVAVTDASGSTTLFNYSAPLTTAAGGAAVVFASGFVDDSQGESFKVYVALADGTTFPLPEVTGIDELAFKKALQLYPNPASNNLNVSYSLDEATNMSYQVVNTLGQTVEAKDLGRAEAGNGNLSLDVSNLNSGLYRILLSVDGKQINRSFVVE